MPPLSRILARPLALPPSLMPLVCLLAVGILLGLGANLAKLALMAGWRPTPFLFWSALGGGLLLLIAAIATGNRPALSRQHLIYALVSGAVSIALPNTLVLLAVPHVGASFVALSYALPLLLTYLLALGLGMERVAVARAWGVLLGLTGTIVLAVAKGQSLGGSERVWIGVALLSPISIAIGNIYRSRSWPAGASALSLAPGMLLGGALLLLPYAALTGQPLPVLSASGPQAGFLAAQAVLFAATYALYFILQRLAGPVYLSQIGSVGAVVGAGLAVAVLGEPVGTSLTVATLLILGGVVLINRKR